MFVEKETCLLTLNQQFTSPIVHSWVRFCCLNTVQLQLYNLAQLVIIYLLVVLLCSYLNLYRERGVLLTLRELCSLPIVLSWASFNCLLVCTKGIQLWSVPFKKEQLPWIYLSGCGTLYIDGMTDVNSLQLCTKAIVQSCSTFLGCYPNFVQRQLCHCKFQTTKYCDNNPMLV